MSKSFFRFLRGELNGYYINALYNSLNVVTNGVYEFFGKFRSLAFKTASLVEDGETPMDFNHIKGLGVFAGVFPQYVALDSSLTSVRFTSSHKVLGVEYSERGLFEAENEDFSFFRTNEGTYDTDINILANPSRRSSMVEEGKEPLGYIPEGVRVFLEDGRVDMSQVIPLDQMPPESEWTKAYTPFYGEEYLYLADTVPVTGRIGGELYYYLIVAMQWIRYNGTSIKSLVELADILCPGYLFITKMEWDGNAYGTLHYGIDEDYESEGKLSRRELFSIVAKMKFIQYDITEVAIRVTRDSSGNVTNVEEI